MGKSIRSKVKRKFRREKADMVDPYERMKLASLSAKLEEIRNTPSPDAGMWIFLFICSEAFLETDQVMAEPMVPVPPQRKAKIIVEQADSMQLDTSSLLKPKHKLSKGSHQRRKRHS